MSWFVSRVCEEFGCTPSVALREIEQHDDLLTDVMEARAFVRTKQACDAAASKVERPDTPMARLVTEFEFAAAREALARRG